MPPARPSISSLQLLPPPLLLPATAAAAAAACDSLSRGWRVVERLALHLLDVLGLLLREQHEGVGLGGAAGVGRVQQLLGGGWGVAAAQGGRGRGHQAGEDYRRCRVVWAIQQTWGVASVAFTRPWQTSKAPAQQPPALPRPAPAPPPTWMPNSSCLMVMEGRQPSSWGQRERGRRGPGWCVGSGGFRDEWVYARSPLDTSGHHAAVPLQRQRTAAAH